MTAHNRQMMLLEQARKRASFDSESLSYVIWGSKEIVEQRNAAFHRVESTLGALDTSKLPKCYANMDREEAYIEGLEWGKVTFEDGINHKHDIFDAFTNRYSLSNSSPFGVHTLLFIPTIELQANAEQKSYWLPLAQSGKINGAYCQTELGHGTFVRGIETTATFDHDTDEFMVHSPTLSSTKFWPGAIGFACSHAIVMARLLIDTNDYGVHPFMMQFRSLDDFTPMPGIELGDMGFKMSYNGTCNGYATFNKVRIPRDHLLMGNARVLRDGTYIKAVHPKLSYATLIYARTRIIHCAGQQLAQAITIASRYSIVREQGLGANAGGLQEVSILTYKSQHYRLLTLISQAYAILFASKDCYNSYRNMVNRQMQEIPDHSTLPFNHMFAAGLKAWATQTGADGAEDARKCCGGQGYLTTSGMPEIVAAVTAMATFEGENYVMWQQVSRYLFKRLAQLRVGEEIDSGMAYLAEGFRERNSGASPATQRCEAHGREFLHADTQLSIFRHRALRLIFETDQLLSDVQSSGLPSSDAWNTHMMAILNTARAHIEYFVLESFHNQVSKIEDENILPVLENLRSLFALSAIENPRSINAISFVEDGYLSHRQLQEIRAHVNVLLAALLPEIIGLTDAWNFTDASLCSAIGMKDGNAYERMMQWTRQMPINTHAAQTGGVFAAGWNDWIKPTLRAKL